MPGAQSAETPADKFSLKRHLHRFVERGSKESLRDDLVAASGEFCGTVTFLLIGLGGVQAAHTSNLDSPTSTSQPANAVPGINELMYISTSMGLGLLFSCWIFYRATGAAFNPNVSFALLLIGIISPTRFIFYTIAQFVASIVASALLQALLPGELKVAPSLGAGTSKTQGLFIEGFITCALVLSVLFLAVEKHRATYLAPLGIGLTLFACHLFAVVYTGAGMNTARAFGPAVVTSFPTEHWIYWVGPTLGSLLAVAIYAYQKSFKYWKLNVGQDTDNPRESPELFVTQVAVGPGPAREEEKEVNQTLTKNPERVSWQTEAERNRNRSNTHPHEGSRAEDLV